MQCPAEPAKAVVPVVLWGGFAFAGRVEGSILDLVVAQPDIQKNSLTRPERRANVNVKELGKL